MADEGNRDRNPNRRMDLNLYLGLPRRRPETDLGSDLALGSLPLSAEMSSSQSESYPPAISSQSTEIPIVRSNDPEYNPYSPSYDHVSSNPETLGTELYDDPLLNPPFLSSFVSSSPTIQDSTEAVLHEGSNSNDAEYIPYSIPAYAPVSLSTPNPASDSQTQPEFPHVPYVPISRTNQITHNLIHENESENRGFNPYQATELPRRLPIDRNRDDSEDRSSWFQHPENRFRRLIDSNRRSLIRRSRTSVPGVVDPDLNDYPPDLGGGFPERRNSLLDLAGFLPRVGDYPSDPAGAYTERRDYPPDLGGALPERLVSEVQDVANTGDQKTSIENLVTDGLEKNDCEDRSSGIANFDCNICLDVAKDPVVTSCGHLFCWPCLYQWLHLHSDHKECPVCKGEVTEENVTPIYGRGSSENDSQKKASEVGEDSGLKIPPRPRGSRTEGFRQRIRRRLGGSWRLVVDEDAANRGERLDNASVQGIFNGANGRVLSRLLAAHQLERIEVEQAMNVGGSGSSRNVSEIPLNQTEGGNPVSGVPRGGGSRSTPSALARRGTGFWPRLSFYGTIATDLSNVVGRMRNSGGGARSSNPPRSSRGASEAVPSADQASASSTIAVIQGENGGQVDAPAEPSSVGSSRILRRRTRNSSGGASSSMDVDGGTQNARKRRRLN